MSKENEIYRAVVIANNFDDGLIPFTKDLPLALLPVYNKPLLDHTMEFLAMGHITETFVFCTFHAEIIKEYIRLSITNMVNWTLTMKVIVIVSETCQSVGDCLRDLDAKGFLREHFVLVEPGTISNINLEPLITQHRKINDKGAAMTLILQESGHVDVNEKIIVAINNNNRILYHKRASQNPQRKINFLTEIFLDNTCAQIIYNTRHTHISICSPIVLSLFSDNFDFQTLDDFVRGLLMNEEILGSTVYCHLLKGKNYGNFITDWKTYKSISKEIKFLWAHPLGPGPTINTFLKDNNVVSHTARINDAIIRRSVIGNHVKIDKNCEIFDSYIFDRCIIGPDVKILNSIIGPHCIIKPKCSIINCILGQDVNLEMETFFTNAIYQNEPTEHSNICEKISFKCYKLKNLYMEFERKEISDDDSDAFRDSEDDELSHTHSPPPDSTKLFFTEVIDSLTRGFEDQLQCDNLILEINSSRYAYNVTLREVNFNVVKAILHMSLRFSPGQQYFSQFQRLLLYFYTILKNYIRNKDAKQDTLLAIEDVVLCNEDINQKWVVFVLKWFYDKDFLSEDIILNWYKTLDEKSKLYNLVTPFAVWLKDAEEESSSEND